jgi:hypothetical protein
VGDRILHQSSRYTEDFVEEELMSTFQTSYDKGARVLYISLGEPKSAKTESLPRGILIRVDRTSNKFVGLTVIDFSGENKELYEEVLKASHKIPEELLPQLVQELAVAR